MIEFEKAIEELLKHERSFGEEEVRLMESTGRFLAEPVLADRDFPPFDRVAMDGIAIHTEALKVGTGRFFIENMQVAGMHPHTLSRVDHCIEVMTGAVLPTGTNAVIPYEKCTIYEGYAYPEVELIEMQNVHCKGKDAKAGDTLVPRYQAITPSVISLLASVGKMSVKVLKVPRVGIIATGDELVTPDMQPEMYQVRMSNAFILSTALKKWCITATVYKVPDDYTLMKEKLLSILPHYDVLLCSGGISKGKTDFLPGVFAEIGMTTIFQQVSQKPGKPLLTGYFNVGPMVFAFPGNPVSTFVSYHCFFNRWLQHCLQQPTPSTSAILQKEINFSADLTLHLLVTIKILDGRLLAFPVESSSSGDLVALGMADGYLTLPRPKKRFETGEAFPYTPFC